MNTNLLYLNSLYKKEQISKSDYLNRLNLIYNSNPKEFTPEDTDFIEKKLRDNDITFNRDLRAGEQSLGSILNQLVSGISEGFTTLGWAEEADTSTEAIAAKVGHLLGFAPDIIAGVLSMGASIPGSLAKRTTAKLAIKRGVGRPTKASAAERVVLEKQAARHTIREEKIRKAGGTITGTLGEWASKISVGGMKPFVREVGEEVVEEVVEETVEQAAKKVAKQSLKEVKGIKQYQIRSVPMRVADWVTKKGNTFLKDSELLSQGFLGRTIGESTRFKKVAGDAIHLGVALGASAVWEGPKGIAQATMHGALAGAVFGTTGEFVSIGKLLGNPKTAHIGKDVIRKITRNPDQDAVLNAVVRGTIGGGFMGGMATAQNQPLPEQIYEYMLGFFFGANTKSLNEIKYRKILMENPMADGGSSIAKYKKQIKSLEEYKEAPEEVQDMFERHVDILYKQQQQKYQEVTSKLVIERETVIEAEKRGIDLEKATKEQWKEIDEAVLESDTVKDLPAFDVELYTESHKPTIVERLTPRKETPDQQKETEKVDQELNQVDKDLEQLNKDNPGWRKDALDKDNNAVNPLREARRYNPLPKVTEEYFNDYREDFAKFKTYKEYEKFHEKHQIKEQKETEEKIKILKKKGIPEWENDPNNMKNHPIYKKYIKLQDKRSDILHRKKSIKDPNYKQRDDIEHIINDKKIDVDDIETVHKDVRELEEAMKNNKPYKGWKNKKEQEPILKVWTKKRDKLQKSIDKKDKEIAKRTKELIELDSKLPDTIPKSRKEMVKRANTVRDLKALLLSDQLTNLPDYIAAENQNDINQPARINQSLDAVYKQVLEQSPDMQKSQVKQLLLKAMENNLDNYENFEKEVGAFYKIDFNKGTEYGANPLRTTFLRYRNYRQQKEYAITQDGNIQLIGYGKLEVDKYGNNLVKIESDNAINVRYGDNVRIIVRTAEIPFDPKKSKEDNKKAGAGKHTEPLAIKKSVEAVMQLAKKFEKKGYYIYNGAKDKGTIILQKVPNGVKKHIDTLTTVLKENGVTDEYLSSHQRRIEMASNLVYKLVDNGYMNTSFDFNIKTLRKAVVEFKHDIAEGILNGNVLKEVKYDTLPQGTTIPIQSKDVADQLVNVSYKDGKVEGYYNMAAIADNLVKKYGLELDSSTDGGLIVRNDVFDRWVKIFGFEKISSFVKPVIVASARGGKGEIRNKVGGFRPESEGLDKFMHDNNIHILSYKSGLKHQGKLRVNELIDLPNDQWKFKDELDIAQIKPEEIGINPDVTDFVTKQLRDINVRKKLTIYKQLLDKNTLQDFSSQYFDEIQSLRDKAVEGLPEANEKLLKDGNSSIDFKIENLGIKEIVTTITDFPTSPAAKKMLKDILGRLTEEGYDVSEPYDIDKETITQLELLPEILSRTDYSINALTENGNFISNAIARYAIGRASRLPVEHGFKSYSGLYTAKRHKDHQLKDNEFMLGEEHKVDPVRIGEEVMTLEKAFEIFSNMKKSDSNYGMYEDALTYLIMRIPNSGNGGVRALLFKGFVKEGGFNFFASELNDIMLGGKDNDGDYVNGYQSISGVIKNAFRKKTIQFELQDGNPQRTPMDLKRGINKYDKAGRTIAETLFGVEFEKDAKEYTDKDFSDLLSSESRIRAALASYEGKKATGIIVNATTEMQMLFDFIKSEGGNTLDIGGNKILEIKTDDFNFLKKVSYTGINIAVDASDFVKIGKPIDNVGKIFNLFFQVRDATSGKVFKTYPYYGKDGLRNSQDSIMKSFKEFATAIQGKKEVTLSQLLNASKEFIEDWGFTFKDTSSSNYFMHIAESMKDLETTNLLFNLDHISNPRNVIEYLKRLQSKLDKSPTFRELKHIDYYRGPINQNQIDFMLKDLGIGRNFKRKVTSIMGIHMMTTAGDHVIHSLEKLGYSREHTLVVLEKILDETFKLKQDNVKDQQLIPDPSAMMLPNSARVTEYILERKKVIRRNLNHRLKGVDQNTIEKIETDLIRFFDFSLLAHPIVRIENDIELNKNIDRIEEINKEMDEVFKNEPSKEDNPQFMKMNQEIRQIEESINQEQHFYKSAAIDPMNVKIFYKWIDGIYEQSRNIKAEVVEDKKPHRIIEVEKPVDVSKDMIDIETKSEKIIKDIENNLDLVDKHFLEFLHSPQGRTQFRTNYGSKLYNDTPLMKKLKLAERIAVLANRRFTSWTNPRTGKEVGIVKIESNPLYEKQGKKVSEVVLDSPNRALQVLVPQDYGPLKELIALNNQYNQGLKDAKKVKPKIPMHEVSNEVLTEEIKKQVEKESEDRGKPLKIEHETYRRILGIDFEKAINDPKLNAFGRLQLMRLQSFIKDNPGAMPTIDAQFESFMTGSEFGVLTPRVSEFTDATAKDLEMFMNYVESMRQPGFLKKLLLKGVFNQKEDGTWEIKGKPNWATHMFNPHTLGREIGFIENLKSDKTYKSVTNVIMDKDGNIKIKKGQVPIGTLTANTEFAFALHQIENAKLDDIKEDIERQIRIIKPEDSKQAKDFNMIFQYMGLLREYNKGKFYSGVRNKDAKENIRKKVKELEPKIQKLIDKKTTFKFQDPSLEAKKGERIELGVEPILKKINNAYTVLMTRALQDVIKSKHIQLRAQLKGVGKSIDEYKIPEHLQIKEAVGNTKQQIRFEVQQLEKLFLDANGMLTDITKVDALYSGMSDVVKSSPLSAIRNLPSLTDIGFINYYKSMNAWLANRYPDINFNKKLSKYNYSIVKKDIATYKRLRKPPEKSGIGRFEDMDGLVKRYVSHTDMFGTKDRSDKNAIYIDKKIEHNIARLAKNDPLLRRINNDYDVGKITKEQALAIYREYQDRKYAGYRTKGVNREMDATESTLFDQMTLNHPRGDSFRVNSNLAPRSGDVNLPEWDMGINHVERYLSSQYRNLINANSMLKIMNNIERFIQKKPFGGSMEDQIITESWGNFMIDVAKNHMSYHSLRNYDIHGIKDWEYEVLKNYLAADLNKEKLGPLRGAEKEFINRIEANYGLTGLQQAEISGWIREQRRMKVDEDTIRDTKDEITANMLRQNIQEITQEKNINKIGRFKSVYGILNDESVVKWTEKVDKIFGGKILKDAPKTQKERELYIVRLGNTLSDLEGKYEMMALLFHPKTFITNIYGGGQNTLTDVGIQPFRDALSDEWMIDNVWGTKDNPIIYKVWDSAAGKHKEVPITSRKEWEQFKAQIGVYENIFTNEAQKDIRFQNKRFLDPFVQTAKKLSGVIKEKGLEDVPTKEFNDLADMTLHESFKEVGFYDAINRVGSSFMRKSEYLLRSRSWDAAYINARQILGKAGDQLAFDNPLLIELANKTVAASQFIYHATQRPNFANTSLGRVMTRFHPYAWNSVGRRLEVYKGARAEEWAGGFKTKRAQRQLTNDMFVFALANIFMSSIFEYALSPPMNWMQDTAQLLFGDDTERERAFFSQYPHPALAPLSIVTPPISRWVLAPTTALLNGNFERLYKYQFASLFPFGRFGRDFYRTFQSPAMFGEFMFGAPVHTVHQLRRDKIEENQEEEEE